jgi:transcriptional regulator with XRE-family HTH domain
MAKTEKSQDRGAFAVELDRFRDARGLTQKDLAEAVGVSQAAVSLWLSGKSVPNPTKVRLLEHFLGANVGELGELAGGTRTASTQWRKSTDVIKEIRPRRTSTTSTSDIGTAEDVALLLAGHTRKTFEQLFAATKRLQTTLGDAQAEMDALREAMTSELPGTPKFDEIMTRMQELSQRIARERSLAERQQVDIADVDKMTERVRFVLGQTALGEKTPAAKSTSESQVVNMTAQVLGGEGRRKGRAIQTGLRSALFRWRHPSTEDRDGALDELLGRLVNMVGMLLSETSEQRVELAELRGEIANLHALIMMRR